MIYFESLLLFFLKRVFFLVPKRIVNAINLASLGYKLLKLLLVFRTSDLDLLFFADGWHIEMNPHLHISSIVIVTPVPSSALLRHYKRHIFT